MLHRAFACIWFPLIHIITVLINFFLKRDKSILLFGSRAGANFAGNPRYLFQYLSENKERYGLSHVVWVTRKDEVYAILKEMNYEVYMMKSWKSFYYHLKAGFYFCNVNVATGDIPQKIKGDLMGELSAGAQTVHLTHSIANIKSNRLVSSDKQNIIIRILKKVHFLLNNCYLLQKYVLYPGSWSSMIVLEKKSSMTEVTEKSLYMNKKNNRCNRITRVSIGFPELCPCIRYTLKEKKEINQFIKGKKIILYVPTYRNAGNKTYIHPLNNSDLRKYIVENDYIWVDKAHPNGNQNEGITFDNINFFKLSPEFDVNTIIPQIDLMITDYSSIMLKAVYFKKGLINYVPDLKEYAENERGFLEEFDNYFMGTKCVSSKDLAKILSFQLDNHEQVHYNMPYCDLMEKYFDNIRSSYEEISNYILNFETQERERVM